MVSTRNVRKTSAPAEPTPNEDETPAPAERPFISEGVRTDILLHGSTIDPLTGRTLTRDDL